MNHYPDEVWLQLLLNLSQYIDTKVCYTGRHSSQVAYWAKSTAYKMMVKEHDICATYWASMLHDIGKISVPCNVLSKKGPLNRKEWVVMKLHPTVGANIIRSLDFISHVAPIIQHHQEKFDGSGYPCGLTGNRIPLGARILAVVDAYDAMVNDRVYRRARSHHEAVRELEELKGKHFDPIVVDQFLSTISQNA